MPLLSTWAGATARVFKVASVFIVNAVTDTFTRTTASNLGTADSGQTWNGIKGTWTANGAQATSADAGSNYSIASVPFKTTGTISATVSEGTGVAWWVSDANNWYATVPYNTSSTYSCGCGTCPAACGADCTNCGCQTRNSCVDISCGCATYGACSSGYLYNGACYSGPVGTGYIIGAPPCTSYNSCPNANCSCAVCNSCNSFACGSYSCGCGSCTSYYYYMRMYKNVSGTVSTVISDTALSAAAASIKIAIVGGTITQTAYSDASLTTQVGTSSTTPSSPTTAPYVGIIKTPGGLTQGTTVDNFSAS